MSDRVKDLISNMKDVNGEKWARAVVYKFGDLYNMPTDGHLQEFMLLADLAIWLEELIEEDILHND